MKNKISYSIKPAYVENLNKYWLAGNGHYNEGEHWIHDKAAVVFIKRIDMGVSYTKWL